MIKLLTLLILGYMIIIMGIITHYKADQDNPMVLLYPVIVAIYGWMGVVARQKWMFLPVFASLGFEVFMACSRLVYINMVIPNDPMNAAKPLDPNNPSSMIVSDFYPAFVVEVNAHAHTGRWFRMRELLIFCYCVVLLFATLLDIDLINRERQEGDHIIHFNPFDILAARDNADVVDAAHPHEPPPSYEVLCSNREVPWQKRGPMAEDGSHIY